MRKLNVLHINAGTKLGGTETMILRFSERADRNQFEIYVGAFFEGGEFLQEAQKRGVQSILFKITNRANLFLAFIKLVLFLKSDKIDIIHLYGFWTGVSGRIAAKLARTPVVIIGQRTEDNWRKSFHSWLDRITSRWVDQYISVFERGKELLIKRDGISKNKVVVVHNGIDLSWVNTAERKDNAFPVVGMVAAFNQFKTQDILIRAVPEIKEKIPQTKFILVGCGNNMGKMTALIDSLGLKADFSLPGFVKDIRPILASLSVLVLSSNSEGCPVSILEAMSFGVPVVASKVGGVPELVENRVTGILVRPKNPDELASAIIEILENPVKAKWMGEAAKERVRKHFTIEQMTGQIEFIYLDWAKRKGLV